MPEWLPALTPENIMTGVFPLRDILTDSLYYPACNIDGIPIRYLGGNVHSFIYVDYGVEKTEIIEQLQRTFPTTGNRPVPGEGLRGYRLLAHREVAKEELVPNGWSQVPIRPGDGDPNRHRRWIKKPFAVWSVFERHEDLTDTYGTQRLSLLYIGGDGAATYQAIYCGNRATAKFLAIIAPGTGFGFNYTDFRDSERILGRVVLDNPYGQPEYLIWDGWNQNPNNTACWSFFKEPVCLIEPYNKIGLWRRTAIDGTESR